MSAATRSESSPLLRPRHADEPSFGARHLGLAIGTLAVLGSAAAVVAGARGVGFTPYIGSSETLIEATSDLEDLVVVGRHQHPVQSLGRQRRLDGPRHQRLAPQGSNVLARHSFAPAASGDGGESEEWNTGGSAALPIRFVHTAPTRSNSGLQTLVAQYVAVSGKPAERLTLADVRANTGKVKAIQSKITRYGASTGGLAKAMVQIAKIDGL